MLPLTKLELIQKLARFPDNAKVYVGCQYKTETEGFMIEACPVIDVESAPIRNVPQILLIEELDDQH